MNTLGNQYIDFCLPFPMIYSEYNLFSLTFKYEGTQVENGAVR